jgi:hypothetical protein
MIEHHTLKRMRDDLWAQLAPLDRYGPADFASVLVDGVLALAKEDPDADDSEAGKANKEDEWALLVGIIAISAAAFLLT